MEITDNTTVEAEVMNPDTSTEPVDQESKPTVNIGEMPIDEYINEVISQTKKAYPDLVTDEIIEDIKKILSNVDSATRISAIKKYRRALKEYHKFDDIDEALIDVENTQKEITRFLKSVNDSDHAQAMEIRKTMEKSLLDSYGLHLAVPTDVEITDMDLAGQLDMPAIRKEAGEARAKAHIYKVAYEAAYRRKMAQTKDNHSLTADVMEQLMHDRDTIERSENINKAARLKDIDAVIDAVENPSFDIIYAKTVNKKRIAELYKEYYKSPLKAKNLINSAGFTDTMVDEFKKFFGDELKFRSMNCQHEFDIKPFNPVVLDECINVFLYHIAKICDVNKKRSSYKTIMYKMLILSVLEVQTTVKPVYIAEERFYTENGVETERPEYVIRSQMFDSYVKMFMSAYLL